MVSLHAERGITPRTLCDSRPSSASTTPAASSSLPPIVGIGTVPTTDDSALLPTLNTALGRHGLSVIDNSDILH